MEIELSCRCGKFQGNIDSHHSYGYAVCYCKDCQAFARFLGRHEDILNRNNGTEILAMLPAAVCFTAGVENLVSMSLSDKGLLRWYVNCCHTPIGNTPRNKKIAYVGLISTCLPNLNATLGPPKIELNTQSAKGEIKATPVATACSVVRIMKHVLGARLSGRYQDNPFFREGSEEPLREPRVLTFAERKPLYGASSDL